MSPDPTQLQTTIAALEAQRALLGDAVVNMAVAPLKSQLASLLRPAGLQRRQVTVLFADVVGSTALAQRLGSEDTLDLLSGVLRRMAGIVEAHQGRVLRFTGDGVKVAFGMDAAREDDAERAVRAGLAIVTAGREQAAQAQRERGLADFAVRVGLHTGDVALGAGLEADNTAMGAAVHIAARMEQNAPPNAMRISHDTYAQVRGLFDVEAQEPLHVKGVDRPMQTYLVHGAKPRSFRIVTRGIEGVATRMIGRDAELQALQAAFLRLFEDRRLATVTVVAEAGIGKSRLLDEFAAWAEARPERFVLFRGRATPQTPLQPYGLLRDIFAWRFQIGDDDTLEVARRKLEDGVVPLFLHDDGPDLAEAHAHLLGYLIGIEWKGSRHIRGIVDNPRQIRSRALNAAAQFFRRIAVAQGHPALVQLEDLHWADRETLDFLNQLTELNKDVPLLLLAFTRPALFEQDADWGTTGGLHQRLDLAPLGADTSRALAGELLKKLPQVPVALQDLLTSRAEGNPFYMEELVKMFIDQGAIQTDADANGLWRVDADRLLVARVPSTLTGVLQARLDGLPAAEKRALQQASVVGAVFWDQALAAVDGQATKQLSALERRQLALPRTAAELGSLLDGLREYAFSHQLLHQVTYDTVLERARREGHAQVGQWIASLAAGHDLRAGDLLGLAADHLERAGNADHAAEFHARAAEHAKQRFAHERVVEHVGRALALLGEPDANTPTGQAEVRWRLLIAREATFFLQARRDEQAVDLGALERLADAMDDDRRRAEVACRVAGRAVRMADWAALKKAAKYALDCASREGDINLRLRALYFLATALEHEGDLAGSNALAVRGLDEARQAGLRGVEVRFLQSLSGAAESRGEYAVALELNRQQLLILREIGNRIDEAVCQQNVGSSLLNLGDLAEAQRALEAALQLMRANDDRVMEGSALGHLSEVALLRGDAIHAQALAKQALDITLETKSRWEQLFAAVRLGDAETALGRRPEARSAYTHALEVAQAINDPTMYDAATGLAGVALAEGDLGAALAALEPVLSAVSAGGTLHGSLRPRLIELTCHLVLARADDARAPQWLQRAHTALMAQADAISDAALRYGFLNNIPWHREIAAAWADLSRGASPTRDLGNAESAPT